jgi:hypothetical protein
VRCAEDIDTCLLEDWCDDVLVDKALEEDLFFLVDIFEGGAEIVNLESVSKH